MTERNPIVEAPSGSLKNAEATDDNGWPEGFFEKYFGIFADDPLEVPEELPWSLDAKRLEFE